jgi:hypothetical protein
MKNLKNRIEKLERKAQIPERQKFIIIPVGLVKELAEGFKAGKTYKDFLAEGKIEEIGEGTDIVEIRVVDKKTMELTKKILQGETEERK